MDRSAINRIEELALAGDAQNNDSINAALGALVSAESRAPLVALPDGVSIHNLEQYLPDRLRYRGHFATDTVESFAEYVESARTDTSTIFVSPAAGHALAVIQDRDKTTNAPNGHGDWTAALKLVKLAEFEAVLAIGGAGWMDQRAAAEWLADWNANAVPVELETIEGAEVAKPGSLSAAINAVRGVTVKSAQESTSIITDHGAARTAMEEIEAKAASGGKLPTFFDFYATPYEGFTRRPFRLRMSSDVRNDKVVISFRIVGLEAIKESIAKEFREKLVSACPNVATFIGSWAAK